VSSLGSMVPAVLLVGLAAIMSQARPAHGLIEVVEDPQRPRAPGTCGAVVMEVCIEP